MQVRVFICHHAVPREPLSGELFDTLLSGAHSDTAGTYIGDLDGTNIANKNQFTELRHQYFILHNQAARFDYVGFEHYRRMFFLDPMSSSRLEAVDPELLHFRRRFAAEQHQSNLDVGLGGYLGHQEMRRRFLPEDIQRLKVYLSHFDVVTQRPNLTQTVKEQWETCFPLEHYDLLIRAAEQSRYFRNKSAQVPDHLRFPVWNNMYIMRTEIFVEYMDFLFDSLGILEKYIEPWHRGWGHCAERLFNFYLHQKVVEDPLFRLARLPYLTRTPAYVGALPNEYAGKIA